MTGLPEMFNTSKTNSKVKIDQVLPKMRATI